MRKLIATLVCCAAFIAIPGALAASGTSRDAYSVPSQRLQVALTAAPKVQNASGSELPLTGMDLSVIGLAGIGLAGMGLALRRLAGRQEKD